MIVGVKGMRPGIWGIETAYSAFGVLSISTTMQNLAAERTYGNLDVSLTVALQHRAEVSRYHGYLASLI